MTFNFHGSCYFIYRIVVLLFTLSIFIAIIKQKFLVINIAKIMLCNKIRVMLQTQTILQHFYKLLMDPY